MTHVDPDGNALSSWELVVGQFCEAQIVEACVLGEAVQVILINRLMMQLAGRRALSSSLVSTSGANDTSISEVTVVDAMIVFDAPPLLIWHSGLPFHDSSHLRE